MASDVRFYKSRSSGDSKSLWISAQNRSRVGGGRHQPSPLTSSPLRRRPRSRPSLLSAPPSPSTRNFQKFHQIAGKFNLLAKTVHDRRRRLPARASGCRATLAPHARRTQVLTPDLAARVPLTHATLARATPTARCAANCCPGLSVHPAYRPSLQRALDFCGRASQKPRSSHSEYERKRGARCDGSGPEIWGQRLTCRSPGTRGLLSESRTTPCPAVPSRTCRYIGSPRDGPGLRR